MHKRQNRYRLSTSFQENIFQFSYGYLPHEKFTDVLKLFQSETDKHFFTYESEANLLRIISNMFDKASMISDCIRYPHYAEILAAAASNSNYLTDILVRNPEFFYSIVNPSELKNPLEEEIFLQKIKSRTDSLKSFPSKLHALRTIKRNEMLKIGMKDILGQDDLNSITSQLTVLAKTISSHLFELCYEEIKTRRGIKNLKSSYCILSLGKLGGRELNYSSDIDLIIFYDNNQQLSDTKTYEEFLTEVTHLFIESISSHSADGFLYRVDFRLRPDGKNSPLCRSFNEYINYYESKGEDWERQMLIKADHLGGSKDLYHRFMNYLSAFIFPSSFRISPTEQIKKLKFNIEKNIGNVENIKLQSGGIRDIEFSVQALQLLNGGRIKSLRTGHTLNAIEVLEKEKLLTSKEAETFSSSYKLYRKIEHFLQLMNDKQTHTIPSEGELLNKLVHYCGYKDEASFRRDLDAKKKQVQKIYNSIIGIEKEQQNISDISSIRFTNKSKALTDLNFLRDGKGLFGNKQFGVSTIESFEAVEKSLIEYLNGSGQPDLILYNFARIIRSSRIPSIWYKAFRDKKLFFSFLKVCVVSQKSADMLSSKEELQEFFLTKKVFEKISEKSLANYTPEQLLFVLSVGFALDKINADKISKHLSGYYSAKIITKSKSLIEPKLSSDKFFIASLGSLGTTEMNFNSDIDLLFVTDKFPSRINTEKIFNNFLSALKTDLFPVEVDCRLKPEGKNSPVVLTIEQYNKYLSDRVRVWELQALTKINFLYGSKALFKDFISLVEKRIKIESSDSIKTAIIEMRKKVISSGISSGKNYNIKKGTGGIVDIEFLIQFFILCQPVLYKKNYGKNVIRMIDSIEEKIISPEDKIVVKQNYLFLKNLLMTNQNLFNTRNNIVSGDPHKLSQLASCLQYESGQKLNVHIDSVFKQNKNLFEKYVMRD
ncbi:MAG: hypothetical protein IPM56_12575 [Ignavibacteriales bacterium]|nr:MAG: hypothetical protein IPM56_12575 [Ignavibacteriales bacterium]